MLIPIIVLAGLICIGLGIHRRMQWRRMKSAYRQWPSVTGTVTAASLRTSRRLDDDNEEYDVWLPIVAYDYAVDGKRHSGGRAFWFDLDFSDRDEAERWLASVPAGAERDIFYNPADPAKAALTLNEPESAPGSGLLFIGVALVIGGFLGPAFR